jgi:hypothetical protein
MVVVALEGAAEGRRLLDSLNFRATVMGPAAPSKEFAERLGIRATPTTFWFSATGEIRDAVAGEPSPAEAREWLRRAVSEVRPEVPTIINPSK